MSSLSPKDRVSLCSFAYSDGRRCRTPRISNHPHFCFYHAQKEARAFAVDKLSKDLAYFFSGDYLSACDLSTALARLIPAVVRGDLKPKAAHTVAYLFQTLMQAIHVSQHEYCEAFDTDDWRQAIRNSVNGNHDYLFPPDPQPALPPAETRVNCHSERSRSTLSSAFAPANASACAVEESDFPQSQTDRSQIISVAHPARGEAFGSSGATSSVLSPTPAQQPAPQPAETTVNCLSGRSEEPAFSPSPAPRQIQAQQNSPAPLAKAPQPAPVAQSFRSWALPPHVRRRLHRDPV